MVWYTKTIKLKAELGTKDMKEEYYPWGGEFTSCSSDGCVAVVLLNLEYTPPDSVAIYGGLKTENIGIEVQQIENSIGDGIF